MLHLGCRQYFKCLTFLRSLVVLLSAGLSIATSSAFAALSAETTSSVISRAMKLTSQAKMEEAEKLYRDLATSAPEDGYPALARFLYRSGRTTATLDLLRSDKTLQAQPPLLRARTAIAAGAISDAIDLLQTPEKDPGREYRRVLLLANQLEQQGRKREAAEALQKATVSEALSLADRKDLFTRLAVTGDAEFLARALPSLIESLVTSSTLSFDDIREVAGQGLIALSASDIYTSFHKGLETEKEKRPSAAWLYTLSSIRRGDNDSAVSAMEAVTSLSLTNREKTILFEELARLHSNSPDRAVELYKQIIPIAPDPDRIRLTTGQILFKSKRFNEALEILKLVDVTKLQEAHQSAYRNVLMTSLGKSSSAEAVIEAFAMQGKSIPWERLRELAEAPFIYLQPADVQKLRTVLESRLSETTAPAELHILAMSLYNRLGNEEAVRESLKRFVDARPDVLPAVQEYADSIGQAAYRLATGDPKSSPPLERLEPLADAAAQAFWRVIERQSFSPEHYVKLMELYKLCGQPEKARQVPHYLTKSTTATAEEVALAAYILATNGYPEDSLPVYERALKLSPNNARIRLNYAGALSRVGRQKDAAEIYRDLIKNGVNGKQFHPHEIHTNSYNLAKEHGYLNEHVSFLKSLISDKTVAQHDIFLADAGKTLMKSGQVDEASEFFRALREKYPQHGQLAADLLVEAMVSKQDFDAAERLLLEESKNTTDTAGAVVVRSNLAVVKKQRGQLDAAIAEWQKLARDFPRDRQATRGLINAANSLIESGRLQQAIRLLQQYLALGTGDVDAEQSARETITRLQKLDVPADAIVQSAIQESNQPTTSTGILK